MGQSFSENFRKVIGNATQKDVAKKLSVSATTISKLLNGQQKPSVDILIKISKAYDCTVDSLLGLKSEEDDEYTYSQFLKMMHYLVEEKKISLKSGTFKFAQIDYNTGYDEAYEDEQETFYFHDSRLRDLVKEYKKTITYLTDIKDEDTRKEFFDLWYEKELKKGNITIALPHSAYDGFMNTPEGISLELPFPEDMSDQDDNKEQKKTPDDNAGSDKDGSD